MTRRLSFAALVSALLLPVLAVMSYAASVALAGQAPGEFDRFGPAGRTLLLGQWSEVYSDPGVQAGPFELAPYGAAALLGVDGILGWAAFFLVFGYALCLALLFTVFVSGKLVEGRSALVVALAVGLVAILGGFLPGAIAAGHPSQVVIPLLWIVAGWCARTDRFAVAGLLVGLSAGWEVWGVLGAPIVLLAVRPRFGLVRAAVAAVTAIVLIYLPFAIAGPFRMFEKAWAVDQNSLVHLVWPDLTTFPWTFRLAQTAAVLVVGSALALLTRRADLGLWLVPLGLVTTRLALDPLAFSYYWFAPVTIALCLAGALALRRPTAAAQWLTVAAAAMIPIIALVPAGRSAVGALVVLIGVLLAGILIAVKVPRPTA